MNEIPCARFELGHVYVTPKADEVLAEAAESVSIYLNRHVTGQWGSMSKRRWEKNETAIGNGGWIVTFHKTAKGGRLLISTHTERSLTLVYTGADDCPREWP